jgi:hypothetical protein
MEILDLIVGPLLGIIMFGLPAAAIILAILALWRWRGWWRVFAAIPLVLIGIDGTRIILDTARDPTSHNLWPLELLLWTLPGLAVIALLWLLRRVTAVSDAKV